MEHHLDILNLNFFSNNIFNYNTSNISDKKIIKQNTHTPETLRKSTHSRKYSPQLQRALPRNPITIHPNRPNPQPNFQLSETDQIQSEAPLSYKQLNRRSLATNSRVWLNQLLQVLVQLTTAQWWSFSGSWHPWPAVRYPFDSHLLWCPCRIEGSVPSRDIRKFVSGVRIGVDGLEMVVFCLGWWKVLVFGI